jgi:citrate lyase beta subunit
MPASLHPDELTEATARLRRANEAFARRYPGEGGARQPVHTVYGGAQLFRHDTTVRLGQVARRALEEYAPDAATLAGALGIPGGAFAERVYRRVTEKLASEPVEDFRIDFEDGYGNRPDAEEDGHAESVAREVARGMAEGTLPPFLGIRVKTLSEELRGRSIRTLDLFLTTLVQAGGGSLPPGFVLTLPKVALAEQVDYFAGVLQVLEPRLGLPTGALRFEIMVEVPQAIIGADGRCMLPDLVRAGDGRITAAHFGTYDYTAGVGITAAHQHMRHAACDYAKHAMQVSLAGTGVWLSDGSTTVMPVPVHRAAPDGPPLTDAQRAENRAGVHRAWKLHYDDVRHSLVNGFYQGWDLHPAQLVTRYAAVFAFFLESVDSAGARLKNFVEKAAQATLVGDVFDDAATGQGLLNYFLRGINCGALTEQEALEMTGLTLDELRGRSFLKILNGRRLLG